MGPRPRTPAPWRRVKGHSPRRSGNGSWLPASRSGPRRRCHANRGLDHKEAQLLIAEENSTSTHAEDLRDQGAVLTEVLTLHPAQLRLSELVREIVAGVADFEQKDAIERAVRDLVGVGLLFRSDDLVLPPRAALRFDELLGEGM